MLIDWRNGILRAGSRTSVLLLQVVYHKLACYLLTEHHRTLSWNAFLYVWPRLSKPEQRQVHRIIDRHFRFLYGKHK